MSRFKAASIHLTISLCIATLVAALIYFLWYPPPYFAVAGGNELMLLIMGVDIVLGPLLTLVVFKAGKKSLRFDLAVIALLQLAAFSYGLSVIAAARPVFIVAEPDRFIPVYANDLDDVDLAQGNRPEFTSRSWTGPRLVAAVPPTLPAEHNAVLMSALAGKDIDRMPKLYVPYAEQADTIIAHAHALAGLIERRPEHKAEFERFAADHGEAIADLVYLPLIGRSDPYTMILSTKTRQPLGALEVDAW